MTWRLAFGAVALTSTLVACSGTPVSPSSQTPSPIPVPASATPSSDPLASVTHDMTDLGDRLVATVKVGGEPEWVATGYGAVWVTNRALNLVQRVDPKTNGVVAKIPVTEPCNGFAVGFGSIWTASCHGAIIRIDPTTNRVTAKIPTKIASDGEGQVTAGAGAVWFADGNEKLERLDPSTNSIVATIAIPTGSSAVAFGYGSVWVTDPYFDTVTQVDPRKDKVVATVAVGPHPQFLALGAHALWTLDQGDGTVSRVDLGDRSVTSIDAESPGDGGCIAQGLGAVWVTIPGTPLTRIDASTDEVTERWVGPGGDCVTAGLGSVWLVNNALKNVYRIAAP